MALGLIIAIGFVVQIYEKTGSLTTLQQVMGHSLLDLPQGLRSICFESRGYAYLERMIGKYYN